MQETSQFQWLGYLIAFVAAGGLLGYGRYWLELRRAPADRGYTIAQTDEIRARIRREDESVAITGLKELAEEVRADRDYWKERAEKAERELLEMALKEPLPKPGNGKGN
jgi:hypothetical protein